MNGEGLEKAAQNVESARLAYQEAHEKARAASLEETRALNDLNRAEQEFDKVLAAFRKASPSASDWGKPPMKRAGGPES